jgi:AbrB family looped-hinge helix DNA binding protein
MDVTLDRFGRILLPKPLRDRLGLLPGARLRVEVSGDRIGLRLVERESILEIRDGVLVYQGRMIEDGAAVLRDVREERIRRSGGLP